MNLRDAIHQQEEALLDFNIVVADARHERNRADERLQELERERDRARVHLSHLVDIENSTKTEEAR